MRGATGGSQAVEQEMQSVADCVMGLRAEYAHILHQIGLFNGEDLLHVDHAGLRQVGFALLDRDITRRLLTAQVRRDQTDNGGGDGAPIENVVLDYDTGMTIRPAFSERSTRSMSSAKQCGYLRSGTGLWIELVLKN